MRVKGGASMASLREQKMAKKKEDILRTAAEVLYEKGYHGATMEDISARLLMTKGSMYYYFKTKEDLYYECHKMIIDIAINAVHDIQVKKLSSVEKLKEAIASHIRITINELALSSTIDNPEEKFSGEYLTGIISMRSKYEACFDQIILDGIESGEFHNVDVKFYRLLIFGAINQVQQWYSKEGNKSKEEIAELFSDYLLRIALVD